MIRSVSVCQCLRERFSPGAGYLGHCPGYPPPCKANFSNSDIVRGRVSRTLSGIPPPLSKFFQLGHCPGQGISDIVWVRVSLTLSGIPPPPPSKFFQLRHCLGQGISDIVQVRVSQTLSGIPPHLANFSSSDIVQVRVSQTLSGITPPLPAKQFFPPQTLSGSDCLGYHPPPPTPPQSKFFQL